MCLVYELKKTAGGTLMDRKALAVRRVAAVFFMIFFFAFSGLALAEVAGDFSQRLTAAREKVDRVAEYKLKGDPSWEKDLKAVYGELLGLIKENRQSAEAYYLTARCYYYNGSPRKAIKAAKNAIKIDASYVDGLVFIGDMHAEIIKNIIKNDFSTNLEGSIHSDSRDATKVYEMALKVVGLSKEAEANIYLKLGDLNILHESPQRKNAARAFWQKAAETLPEGVAAKSAVERLNKK